jgi:hexosaminidase
LSCFGSPIGVPSEEFGPLPISIAPAKKVPSVLENVLTEIFPSQYIHIGGDEATKDHWKTCPDCQKNSKEGLKV